MKIKGILMRADSVTPNNTIYPKAELEKCAGKKVPIVIDNGGIDIEKIGEGITYFDKVDNTLKIIGKVDEKLTTKFVAPVFNCKEVISTQMGNVVPNGIELIYVALNPQGFGKIMEVPENGIKSERKGNKGKDKKGKPNKGSSKEI